MKTAITTGLWEVKETPNPMAKGQFTYEIINQETGGLIASISDGETPETRNYFDVMYSREKQIAKLIAESPALLNALTDFCIFFEQNGMQKHSFYKNAQEIKNKLK